MKDAVLTVRLPRATRARIEKSARQEGRSLSQQVERLIEAGLAAAEEERIRPPTRILADVLHGGIVPGLGEFRAARRELSRLTKKMAMIDAELDALIARESARRLAALGGSEKGVRLPPRQRPAPTRRTRANR